MKSIMKKTIAGISALAMTAAMTATTIPAFASEVDAIEAQNFVASYASEQEQAVAQYCADNCDTLEEAAEFMDLYEEGLALRASEESDYALLSTSSSTKKEIHINDVYYNGTRVASTPHRMVLLAMNKMAALRGFVEVTWNQKVVSYDMKNKPYTINSVYTGLTVEPTIDDGEQYISVSGRIKKTSDTPQKNASTLCYFPIEITGYATSEAAIHSAFTVDTRGIYSTNGVDSDIQLHTYALGDYDHNGVVNAADASYLLELVTHTNDIDFIYNSSETGVVGPISALAADANEDGTVSLADVTWINRNKSE